MAQLEIRDSRGRTIVELGSEPLTVGFDAAGRAAWGRHAARGVTEVSTESLEPGQTLEIEGLRLTLLREDADPRAAAIADFGNLLWSEQSAELLFDTAFDKLFDVLGIDRAAVALFNEDELLEIEESRGEGLELNATITHAVIESGAAILTSETDVHDASENEFSVEVRSILCTPLRHAGHAQGVLYLDGRARERPFNADDLDFASALAHLLSFALANRNLREENVLLKERLSISGTLDLPSLSMAEVYQRVEKVAGFETTVLITGESGVGKEVVAREIHGRSPFAKGPFVAVNCAAIPDTLLESELFGYAPKSAIAGADPRGRAGRFEQADDGTIFLDEIGELHEALQAKLLRVLQDKKVDRLNDTASRDINVRIVVATNQDLRRLVKEGRFREDLFYRLDVVSIEVPPLRERRDDIALLAEFFVRTYPGPEPLRKAKISKAAGKAMDSYDWPGNVRELRNAIEQALILGDGKTIRLKDLPDRLGKSTADDADGLPPLSDVEKDHIARVLRATGWNKAKSARVLGISKPTLYDKIKNYGLEPE